MNGRWLIEDGLTVMPELPTTLLSNIPGVDDAAQSLDLPMAGFLAFTDANTSVAFAFR
jgi:hypothetical protein